MDVNDLPSGADSAKSGVGRLYDYYLNGRQYSPTDVEVAREILNVIPETHYVSHANRVFLQCAAGVVARVGVRQFIDIGAGIPTRFNTHETVQDVAPDATVIYVDNDPAVLAKAREVLRQSNETNVIYIAGDIRDPDSILENHEVRARIDFDQPVGYMQLAVWPFVSDEADPWGLVRRYMDAAPSGSYLALSHYTSDGQRPDKVQKAKEIYQNSATPVYYRTIKDIARFFDGLEFLPPYEGAEPSLSFIGKWGSEHPDDVNPAHTWGPCGVARKP